MDKFDTKEKHELNVKNYFAAKALHYDKTDEQLYWQLSDELLWKMLRNLVVDRLAEDEKTIRVLDAGGGTGRWAKKILDFIPNAHVVLIDQSREMLAVAATKFENASDSQRVEIIEADIHDLSAISDNTFDLVICLHNVLSFVHSPHSVLLELHRVAKPEGYLVSVMANRYHAFHFSIAAGRTDEVQRILENDKVRFGLDTPDMHVFTPKQMVQLHRDSGCSEATAYGFPVTIYPSMEETKLFGNGAVTRNAIDTRESFERLLNIEFDLCIDSEAAPRGNMLLILGQK